MERGLPILLVEDNPDDAIFFQRAFKRLQLGNVLNVVSSGPESIKYLRGVDSYSDRSRFPFPSVILMSLSSPERGAFEVLEWLRSHPECNVIPIILFSNMQQDALVKKAFALGIHGYFEKPIDTEVLTKNLKQIYEYWCTSTKPKVPPSC